jgi:hypothetical protein
MALGLFAQIGLIAHLFSLLQPALGSRDASLAAGMATVCAIAGRTLAGRFLPHGTNRRMIAAANHGVQACGCAFLLVAAGTSVPLLLAGVLLVGAGIGNATSLPPLIAQAEFDETLVPRVVASITALSQATYAFAPAIFGALRDRSETAGAAGPAPAVFAMAAAILAIAAGCYLAGIASARRPAEARN